MRRLWIIVPILSAMMSLAHDQGPRQQDKWKRADASTVRLPPQDFHQLPRRIVHNLQGRGCTIPQAFSGKEPHNVVRGEFMKEGQIDWAVLCSRNKRSSVLVFWGGSDRRVSAIAESADSGFLQTIDGGESIGFSRSIGVVGRYYILKHYHEYDGPKPPGINHQGIDDAYVEKASVVHYYDRGRWLELQGAD